MRNYLAVFIGGGFGAVARFAVSAAVSRSGFFGIPLGTFFVNVTGSLLLGFCLSLFESVLIPVPIRTFITMGFFGAYTTFSTYTVETVRLIEQRQYLPAALNFSANNILGFLAVLAGFVLSGVLLKMLRGGV